MYLQIDAWLQPKLTKTAIDYFQPNNPVDTRAKYAGIAAFFTYMYKTNKGSILLKLGTKTSGFLQGELLRGGIIVKETIAWQF